MVMARSASGVSLSVSVAVTVPALEALAVAHAAAVDLEPFLDMLASVFPREDSLVSYLGPVIGAHGGPGCLGVAYLPAGAA